MSRLRTHWPHPEQPTLSWCGIPAVQTTSSESAVTCRPCGTLLLHAEADRMHGYGVAVPVAESALDAGTRRIVDQLKRQEDAPRPWPSWQSAVRAYQRWADDGAPLRSSADPSRFEAISGPTGIAPDGDLAQRQAGRLGSVGVAIRNAYAEPFVVTTYPVRREVPADECLRILVVVVCGAERHTHTGTSGGKRKQRIVERFPVQSRVTEVSVTDGVVTLGNVAAHASERAGFEVTVGDVRGIVKVGARAIEGSLWRGGLVSQRDKGLEDAMAEKITPWDLDGWEAVAEALDVDVSTAKRWEREGLPIERYGGMVRAESARLRAWLPTFLASRKTG